MTHPNILLIVSDQERHRGWLPDDVALPHRERLMTAGTSFERHYTNTSPCSPSHQAWFPAYDPEARQQMVERWAGMDWVTRCCTS